MKHIPVFDRFKIHPYFCSVLSKNISILLNMQIFDHQTIPIETDMISKLKWIHPGAWNSIFPSNLCNNFQFAVTICGSPSGPESSHFVSLSLWNGGAVWIISLRETLASHNPTLHSWLCRAGDAGCRQGRLSQNTFTSKLFKSVKTITQNALGSSYQCQPDGEHVSDVSTNRLVDKTTQPEIWNWKEIVQYTDLIWLVMKCH